METALKPASQFKMPPIVINKTFVRGKPRPDALLRIFCFNYAGSSAQLFFNWNDYVPDWVEISGFELPGHGGRLIDSKALERYKDAALYIADALTLMLDKPYVLFGHCLGGMLAYEATRILKGRNARQPLHLLTSGARGPHYGLPLADCESMNDEEFIRHFIEVYGAPIGVLNDVRMRPLIVPMVRADSRMTQFYRYEAGPPVDYNITAVAGETDPDVHMRHLEGWRQHTTAKVTNRLYPGNHFFFMERAGEMLADFLQDLDFQRGDPAHASI